MSSFIKSTLLATLALGFCLVLTTLSHATVTTVALYRGGEDDPGAGDQVVAGSTVDVTFLKASIGNDALLKQVGTGKFSADTAAPGSTLSVVLSGGSFSNQAYRADMPASLIGLSTNWGMEVWLKMSYQEGTPWTEPYLQEQHRAYSVGDGDGNGISSTSQAGIPVWTTPGTRPTVDTALLGEWFNYAIVYTDAAGGTRTDYINGIPIKVSTGSSSGGMGNGFFNGIWIGTTGGYGGNRGWGGVMDEMRAFTFESGQFSVSDLNLAANGVPEPSTFILAALGLAGLGLFAWNKRRKVSDC